MRNLPWLLFYSEVLVFRLIRHLFLFVFMILLFTWVVSLDSAEDKSFLAIFKSVAINSMFFFGYAYITAYLLVPWLIPKKSYLLFIFLFLGSGMIISWLKFIFSDYIFYTAISADLNERIGNMDFAHLLMNTKDMTFIVAIFMIAKFSKDNYHANNRLRELKDQQLRSEIKLLKNQLDPHVVFNNLNNIYSLSLNNQESLLVNLGIFRSLLSYYFMEGKAETVSLRAEIENIENYINLEKLRYGDRLNIEFLIEGETSNKNIVPFILFSFIENCFDYFCCWACYPVFYFREHRHLREKHRGDRYL